MATPTPTTCLCPHTFVPSSRDKNLVHTITPGKPVLSKTSATAPRRHGHILSTSYTWKGNTPPAVFPDFTPRAATLTCDTCQNGV
jgi:hypothetical protein